MNNMKEIIEGLKCSITRLESVVDDLESEAQEREKDRNLPFPKMNVLISYGFTPGAIIEIDGERRYVFQGFYEWNHDIVAQFKSLTNDANKDKIVSQDVAGLVDRKDRWKIIEGDKKQ